MLINSTVKETNLILQVGLSVNLSALFARARKMVKSLVRSTHLLGAGRSLAVHTMMEKKLKEYFG